MGRALDTPVDQPDVGFQCVDSIHFEIPHLWDSTSMVLAKASIRVDATITNYDVRRYKYDVVATTSRDATTMYISVPVLENTQKRIKFIFIMFIKPNDQRKYKK